MAAIDQVVPQLASLGIHVTAAVVPARTLETAINCVNQQSVYTSWADLGSLRDAYGLTVVSNSYNHDNLPTLPISQQFQVSCGSLAPIIAHGHHRAWGLFAYPNNQYSVSVQTAVVDNCFAFGRTYVKLYSPAGVRTNQQSTMAAPWLQNTVTVSGGRCNDSTQPCSKSGALGSPWLYASPVILAALTKVAAGDWTTIQFYSFLTGANTSGSVQWDCTSTNWKAHWTSTYESYCLNDLLTAMSQIPSSVAVVDPATVAESWGRIPTPLVSLDPANPSSLNASTPSTTISWSSPENGVYTVLVGGTDCSSGTPLASGTYMTSPAKTSNTVPASSLPSGQDTIRVCLANDAGHTGSATTPVNVAPPVPTVSGVSPATGPTAGGTAITVTGTNFTADAIVSVGGQAAANVTVTSTTSITAITQPVTSPGAVDVVISEAAGTSSTTPADQFLYA